jgi:hypothetical protein
MICWARGSAVAAILGFGAISLMCIAAHAEPGEPLRVEVVGSCREPPECAATQAARPSGGDRAMPTGCDLQPAPTPIFDRLHPKLD